MEAVIYSKSSGRVDRNLKRTDIAYCLRKVAGLYMRENRNLEAKHSLEEALRIYTHYYQQYPVEDLNAEIQLTLDLLRSVAYNLKDGELLEQTVKSLLKMNFVFSSFKLKCYESLYLLEFSRRSFAKALEYSNDTIDFANKNKLPLATHYRHLAKAHLAYLEYTFSDDAISDCKSFELSYLRQNVEANLWLSYDENKQLYQNAKLMQDNQKCDVYADKLIKDFIFMFAMRCKMQLLTGEFNESANNYVLRQAKKINLDFNHTKQLSNMLNTKIDEIFEGKNLPLDYDFFGQSAPVIAICIENAELLFPDRKPHQEEPLAKLTVDMKGLLFEASKYKDTGRSQKSAQKDKNFKIGQM